MSYVRLVLLSVDQMQRLARTSHVRAVSPGLMTVVSSAALPSPSRFASAMSPKPSMLVFPTAGLVKSSRCRRRRHDTLTLDRGSWASNLPSHVGNKPEDVTFTVLGQLDHDDSYVRCEAAFLQPFCRTQLATY